jgi:hypothetical protein
LNLYVFTKLAKLGHKGQNTEQTVTSYDLQKHNTVDKKKVGFIQVGIGIQHAFSVRGICEYGESRQAVDVLK